MIRHSSRVVRHQTIQHLPGRGRVFPGSERFQNSGLSLTHQPSSAPSYSTFAISSRSILRIHSESLTSEGNKHFSRHNHTSPKMVSEPIQAKDWSAQQYLKFGNERTRPVYDLVSQVVPLVPSTIQSPRIYDLGCGPGNSTQVLKDAIPNAQITGMDSSPDMLRKARATLPDVTFEQGDLSNYSPSKGANLLFSNAVFHWLRHSSRIPTIVRLFETLESGGVLAFQVPDNYNEPSHRLMRETALQPNTPWEKYFADAAVGDLSAEDRPDLDPIEPASAFYNALIPSAEPGSVNVWRTTYQHALPDARGIVEWVKGTGLQPYLHRIEDGVARQAFYQEYERRLKEAYPPLADGKVLLAYPRLFVVAVRK